MTLSWAKDLNIYFQESNLSCDEKFGMFLYSCKNKVVNAFRLWTIAPLSSVVWILVRFSFSFHCRFWWLRIRFSVQAKQLIHRVELMRFKGKRNTLVTNWSQNTRFKCLEDHCRYVPQLKLLRKGAQFLMVYPTIWTQCCSNHGMHKWRFLRHFSSTKQQTAYTPNGLLSNLRPRT